MYGNTEISEKEGKETVSGHIGRMFLQKLESNVSCQSFAYNHQLICLELICVLWQVIIMPGKRKTERERISWTRDMNIHLLQCRDNAKILNAGENCPRKTNGRKIGYMEIMYNSFLEKFPGCISLTPQNLRDQISQAEKCQQCQQTPLEVTYRSEINSLQQIPMVDETRNDNDRNLRNTGMNYDEPLNEMECRVLNKAKELFDVVKRDHGSMKERKWMTRTKHIPSSSDIKAVNKIAKQLLDGIVGMPEMAPMTRLWMINCITYASIVAWYLTNDIKCEIMGTIGKKKKVKYKWLKEIDEIIANKRKLLSQCVAEIE